MSLSFLDDIATQSVDVTSFFLSTLGTLNGLTAVALAVPQTISAFPKLTMRGSIFNFQWTIVPNLPPFLRRTNLLTLDAGKIMDNS